MLQDQGMEEKAAIKYLKPVKELLSDIGIWRNPSEGMAILLGPGMAMQYFILPLKFKPFTYVSDHFHLLPLLPLFEIESSFYLLALSQDHVKLYEGNMFEIQDLFVNEFAPERLEEAVGFDFEQKMLQFRSGHMLYNTGSFHGHGEGKDDDAKEISYFFREINKGVNATIRDKKAPLIVACVDWLYPAYKEVNTYPMLHPEFLGGDPEYKSINTLQKEALELVRSMQLKKTEQIVNRYTDLMHTARTSHQISEIVPASVHGKIDTLFLREGDDVFGTFNKAKDCVILDSEQTSDNLSLPNLAAMNTFLKGGKVYTLDKEDMPYKKRPLNALFRY